MENKEETIVVIILFVLLIGIASYTFIDHSGISEIKAQALVIDNVTEEYNLTKSEIAVTNVSSTSFNGYNAFNVSVVFHTENKTYNASYIVNSNNGNITRQNITTQ